MDTTGLQVRTEEDTQGVTGEEYGISGGWSGVEDRAAVEMTSASLSDPAKMLASEGTLSG